MILPDSVVLGWIAWEILSVVYLANGESQEVVPRIVIGVLVRNKAFSLPYFFQQIANLNYPKTRIGVIVYEDHSIDKSGQIVELWCKNHQDEYAFVDCVYDKSSNKGYENESSPSDWTKDRMGYVIYLRDKLLLESSHRWADYLFMIDADVMLTNRDILSLLYKKLVLRNEAVISPVLNCTSLPLYSNFWDGISPEGLYLRTDRYFEIKNSVKRGIYNVPVVYSAILFNLNHNKSHLFSFKKNFNSQHIDDDIVNFAMNSKFNNISLLLDNEAMYGYFPGPSTSARQSYFLERNTFTNLLFHYVIYNDYTNPKYLDSDESLKLIDKNEYKYEKIDVDEVILINLKRRKNRRKIIEFLMHTMEINFRVFPAIDGNNIDQPYLIENSVSPLKEYVDPYFHRQLTFGEIGCFLSHYLIWKEMVERNLTRIIVLEDDIKINSEFPFVVNDLLREADSIYPEWEFFYLGRKIMSYDKERFINGSRYILIPNYSYRTTGYVLTIKGARKLLDEKPLEKIIALDEFIPIMYGKNPHEEWLKYFRGKGQLKAIACYPVVVQPSHFKGERDYLSDTESSTLV